jgi:CxxC motif-containing protein (DUF1111 family)
MGLTTPVHPRETAYLDGRIMPPELDPAADPEIDEATLSLFVDFVRFLAPLPRLVAPDSQGAEWARRGEAVFERIGCVRCHTPFLETGPNEVAALDRKRVYLYSDLLLHDLGPERIGACGIGASPTELRTEPLAGLGYRRAFLHDLSAVSIPEAIDAHGGSAAAMRAAYHALNELEREYLIRFLRTL